MKLNARRSGFVVLGALMLLMVSALAAPANATPLTIDKSCQSSSVAPSGNFQYQLTCPAGSVALGGGFQCVDTDNGYAPLPVTLSADTFGYYVNTWQVIGTSNIGDNGKCTACVSCAPGACNNCPTP
jgi:hypothetical protein